MTHGRLPRGCWRHRPCWSSRRQARPATRRIGPRFAPLRPASPRFAPLRSASAALTASESALACGGVAIEAPVAKPSYSCREGAVVLGPVRIPRASIPSTGTALTFSNPAPDTCIIVTAGRHHWPAHMKLDDALVVPSELFSPHSNTLERPLTLDPKAHTITVLRGPEHDRVHERNWDDRDSATDWDNRPGEGLAAEGDGRGAHDRDDTCSHAVPQDPDCDDRDDLGHPEEPDAWIEVTVRSGASIERHGLVHTKHLSLFNLFATPPVLSSVAPAITFTADGLVRRFSGKPPPDGQSEIRWHLDVRDATGCVRLRRIAGVEPLGLPSSFALSTVFDGKDATGVPLGDGRYTYRIGAALARLDNGVEHDDDHDGHIVAALHAPMQMFSIDTTSPIATIVTPANGGFFTALARSVAVTLTDPLVGGFASGIDPASVIVWLDGFDVTAELVIDEFGIAGTLEEMTDGTHTLAVFVLDRVGNPSATAVSTFTVDSVAPRVVWKGVPLVTDLTDVPLAVSLADDGSGLVTLTLALHVNGTTYANLLTCSPSDEGVAAADCAGTSFLPEGVATVWATVEDRAGNVGAAVITLVVDRSPPVIILDPNPTGIVTSDRLVPLIGRVVELSPVTLTVNGNPVPVRYGAFLTQVPLKAGQNIITLHAVDAAGHMSDLTVQLRQEEEPPVIDSLLVGGQNVACVDPSEGSALISIDDTMSPSFEAAYSDNGSPVEGYAVSLTLDGIKYPCTKFGGGNPGTGMNCNLDMASGYHRVVLHVPDQTGAPLLATNCVIDVYIDAISVRGLAGTSLQDAEVFLPRHYAPPVPVTLTLDETVPVNTPTSSGRRTVGPAVTISPDVNLPYPATARITLPYDPTLLQINGDEISEEEVRAEWRSGATWVVEDTPHFTIDVATNTVSYNVTHFSLRAATVLGRRPWSAVAPATMIDNGAPQPGDESLMLLDVRNLTRGELVNLGNGSFVPTFTQAERAELRRFGQFNFDFNFDQPASYESYVKAVKYLREDVSAVLLRHVLTFTGPLNWIISVPGVLTLDIDELLLFHNTGAFIGRVRVWNTDKYAAEGSAVEGGLLQKKARMSIRDFVVSPDQQRLYLLGDTSWNPTQNAGDGLYVHTVNDLALSNQRVVLTQPAASFPVGESGSLAVSDHWGGETVFVLGSGPQGWLASFYYLPAGTTQDGRELGDVVDQLNRDSGTAIMQGHRLNLAAATPMAQAALLAPLWKFNAWMVRSGPYGGFESLPLATLVGMYGACGIPVSADGILAETYPAIGSVDLNAKCPEGQSFECCYLRHALGARQFPLGDLAADAMEAGQVLVLQNDGTGFSRVGTLPAQPGLELISSGINVNGYPYESYAMRAGLSDPHASMAVDAAGGLWVRQSNLTGGVGHSPGQDLRGEMFDTVAADWLYGTLTRIPLPGTDIRAAVAGRAAAGHEKIAWATLPCQDSWVPWEIGRSNVVLRPGGSALVVAPSGDVAEYSASTVSDGEPPADHLPLIVSPIARLYPVSVPGVSTPATQIPMTAFATTAAVTIDGVVEDTLLVAGVRGIEDGTSTARPMSFIARYVDGKLAGAAPQTENYHFDAMGDVARSPIAIQGSRLTIPQSYPFPKPLLSLVNPISGSGTANELARFATERMGTLRILLRRLQLNAGQAATAVDTSLSAYKDYLNTSVPQTGVSVPVVRVFVGPYHAASGKLLTHWPDAAGSLAGQESVVLVSPEPVLDASGQPDKSYMFFIAADGDGNPRVFEDCNFGTLVSYPGVTAPARAVGCNEKADDDCECTHDLTDICVSEFDMPSQKNVRQYVFADLVVCGEPSHVYQSSPTDKAYLDYQQSLVSEPLHVIFGTPAEKCVTAADCIVTPGPCVDGYCCDQPCGGNSLTDCMACSVETGSTANGVCRVLPWGRICGQPDASCALPPHCDGFTEVCPGDSDHDGHFVAGSCGTPNDDCDDTSATSYTNATEICDGVDNNCNDVVDEGFDSDGDGFSDCADTPGVLWDCDRTNANVHPAARDVCNGIDDDCDGVVDPTCRTDHGAVGSIDGRPGAQQGAATYEIPIVVPPGRRGMTPTLALTYNSRHGSGIAGVGWDIAGLSAITRCPHTVAQDGIARSINYNRLDRLCIDGARLVLMPGSPGYGEDGSEYRTEVESYRRITLHGRTNDATSYFVVEEKSGRIRWYGAEDPGHPAIVVPEGQPDQKVLVWMLARDEDDEGNSIVYEYSAAGSGPTLQNVYYTGVGATRGDRSIRFNYVARNHDEVAYRALRSTKRTQRLSAVTTYVGDAVVKRYELAARASAGSERPLLESVTECAANPCSAGIALPPTTFAYSDSANTPVKQLIDANELAELSVIGDYDGDGQRDLLDSRPYPGRIIFSSGCRAPTAMDSSYLSLEPLRLANVSTEDGDVDGDGRADVVGVLASGMLGLRSFRCVGDADDRQTNIFIPTGIHSARKADFNRDGLTDLLLEIVTDGVSSYVLHLQYHCPASYGPSAVCFYPGQPVAIPEATGAMGNKRKAELYAVIDLDGDGMADIVWDNPGLTYGGHGWIQFASWGPGDALELDASSLAALGGPGSSLLDTHAQFMDLNGDGLVDIVVPNGGVWLNHGGMFWPATVTNPVSYAVRWNSSVFALDYDGDGQQELMVPVTLVDAYCYDKSANGCIDPKATDCKEFCGEDFSNSPPFGIDSLDRSIYRWDAIKFYVQPDGTIDATALATTFEAPVNEHLLGQDINGDGFEDVLYSVRTLHKANLAQTLIGHYEGNETFGAWVASASQGPDLMASATDGFGYRTQWHMLPLSSTARPATCAALGPPPLYSVDYDLDPPLNYTHWTSGMYVVAQFDTSNGVGGVNPTCYRYADGLVNIQGRGFSGFGSIIAEEALPPAAGEPDMTQQLSVNNLRTTTIFEQEFPLSGRVKASAVHLVSDAVNDDPLRQTENTWEDHVIGVSHVVRLAASKETRFDLARLATGSTRAKLGVVATTYDYAGLDFTYGNPSAICTVASDAITTKFKRESFVYDYQHKDEWWFDQLRSATSQEDLVAGLGAETTVTCSTHPWSSVTQTLTSAMEWTNPVLTTINTNVWNARQRRLFHRTSATTALAQRKSREQIFAHDIYGNVTSTTTSGTDAAARLTTSTYTADGYFPLTQANLYRHTSTTLTDAGLGLPTAQQAMQGGPWTRLAYDGLGRLASSTTQGASAMQLQLLTCDASCPANATRRRVTKQAGYPSKTEYLDLLGRTVRVEQQGFLSGPSTKTDTTYNARGQVVSVSAPSASAPQFSTSYSGFDALGRPASKTVPRSMDDGQGDLVSHYSYCGLGTRSEVMKDNSTWGPLPCDAARPTNRLTQWRTNDTLGQVTSTVDALGNATVYGYDGHGNLVLTRDAAGNETVSIYDAFDGLVTVEHPDRGTRTITRNGLGEVIADLDGRGTTVSYVRDSIGRVIARLVQNATDAAPKGDAIWLYDGPGAPGLLWWEKKGDLSREYFYDAYRRPSRTTTMIGQQSFTSEQTYDTSGRLLTSTSPSGEKVSYGYDSASGRLRGESSLTKGYTGDYRSVLALYPSGQIAGEEYGNGLAATYGIDTVSGQMLNIKVERQGAPSFECGSCVYQQSYGYDRFYNLTSRTRGGMHQNLPLHVSEAFSYDDLYRLTSATRTWTSQAHAQETVGYRYDAIGNVLVKDDYSATTSSTGTEEPYRYGSSARTQPSHAGPHAVRQVEMPDGSFTDFEYDDNGNLVTSNVVSGVGRKITYDAFDKPVTIEEGGLVTTFSYGPNGELYKQEDGPRVVYYLGNHETEILAGIKRTRDYVGAAIIVHDETGRHVLYAHRDRLGSVDVVTNQVANSVGGPVQSQGFDAFGLARSGDWTSTQGKLVTEAGGQEPATMHGFTGHEQLDQHTLIHMRGRVYDPRLGRFLSVDPVMDLRAGSQGLNPYSYVQNRPLGGVDPTGYYMTPTPRWVTPDGGDPSDAILSGAAPVTVYSSGGSYYGGLSPRDQALRANQLAIDARNIKVARAEQGGTGSRMGPIGATSYTAPMPLDVRTSTWGPTDAALEIVRIGIELFAANSYTGDGTQETLTPSANKEGPWGQTHCNYFTAEVATALRARGLSGTASQQFDTMVRHPEWWQPVDSAGAIAGAQAGKFVAAPSEEHISVVIDARAVPADASRTYYHPKNGPGTPRPFTSAPNVPSIMQAGHTMGFMSQPNGWGETQPRYFIYIGGE